MHIGVAIVKDLHPLGKMLPIIFVVRMIFYALYNHTTLNLLSLSENDHGESMLRFIILQNGIIGYVLES